MKQSVSTGAKLLALLVIVAFGITATAKGQTGAIPPGVPIEPLVKVTRLSDADVADVIKPRGKPLLINFWATWCDPCREEFPDLVKIDAEYGDKIDFITISLDELSEINRDVPKFLHSMKAEMPAYLLKAADQDKAISTISKDWRGGLPYTILFGPDGKPAYSRQGKVTTAILRRELDKLGLAKPAGDSIVMDFVRIKDGKRDEAIYYYENNWKLYRQAALKKGVIKSYELIEVKPVENALFDLILVTRYHSEQQRNDSEKNFEPVMKELRPAGPLLKNDLKPEDFRQSIFLREGSPVAASGL